MLLFGNQLKTLFSAEEIQRPEAVLLRLAGRAYCCQKEQARLQHLPPHDVARLSHVDVSACNTPHHYTPADYN